MEVCALRVLLVLKGFTPVCTNTVILIKPTCVTQGVRYFQLLPLFTQGNNLATLPLILGPALPRDHLRLGLSPPGIKLEILNRLTDKTATS